MAATRAGGCGATELPVTQAGEATTTRCSRTPVTAGRVIVMTQTFPVKGGTENPGIFL